MKKQITKDFFWNTIGSLFNSFTSLFFLIIIVRINGVEKSGIFTFAFSTAVFFQIIGLYCGRPFQVTELNKKITDSDYVNSRYITCSIMLIVGVLFCLIKKYSRYKTLIMVIVLLYKMIEAFSEVLYGVIQKNNKLDIVGKSLFMKGFFGVLLFLIIDLLTKNMMIASISLIITNLFILLVYDLHNFKKCNYVKTKFNKEIFKVGFNIFLVTFLTLYLINAPKFAIDNSMNSEAQTIYGIISMPATFMVLCSQFLLHPFLNKLTNHLQKKEYKAFNKLTVNLCTAMFIIGFFVIIVAYFLGIPVLELLYGISLKGYLLPFILIIAGSIVYGTTIIIQNALIALRITKEQVIIYVLDSLITFILSIYLVKIYKLIGASMIYLICMTLLFVMYIVLYYLKIRKNIKEDSND